MGMAYGMRRMGVKYWQVYVLCAGPVSWSGLMLAHLHPALALAVIVPFMPPPRRDKGLFAGEDEIDVMGDDLAHDLHMEHSPRHLFEHQVKGIVDFGLFFFATAAFVDPALQGQAKMGALFSGFVGLAAILIARIASVIRSGVADEIGSGVGEGMHAPVPMAAKGHDD